VLGSGKSKAGRHAARRVEEDEISLDFVAIEPGGGATRISADLPLAGAPPEILERFESGRRWLPLDFVAYCFDESQTERFYTAKGRSRDLRWIEPEPMLHLAEGNLFMGVGPDHRNARREAFRHVLTSGGLKGLVGVPWCDSVEEKGDLMREFFERAKEN
jgi:hypothetical protein